MVYNFVRYLVRNPDLTDDITSQVFEKVLGKLDSYQAAKGSIKVWLLAISRNEVANHFKRRKWRALFSLDLFHPDTLREEIDSNPEVHLYKNDAKRNLLEAMQRLREREREILALKFSSDCTNREIAKLTGLTESNIGVLLYRLIKRLRFELKKVEGEV